MINENILRLLKQIKELVSGKEIKPIFLPKDIETLQAFFKRHSLEHLLFDIAEKNLIKEAECLKNAKQKKNKAIFKGILQQEATNKAKLVFEKEQIPYILLKGAIIKKLYAESWMRTSDDVDILVKLQDIERAEKALKNAGFTFASRSTHDVSFLDENKIKIELHYDLIEDNCIKNAGEVLKNVWDKAEKINENSCEFCLPDEFAYFYHIAHLAKHFSLGGCGVRAILDTYILNSLSFDKEKRDQLLKEGGLDVFAKKIQKLASVWFNQEKNDDKDVEFMAEYIIRGGSFGSFSNFASAGKVTRLNLFFPKKSDMEKLYPQVKKQPILLPIFWIVRIVKKSFKGNAASSIKKIKAMNVSSNSAELFKKIGL